MDGAMKCSSAVALQRCSNAMLVSNTCIESSRKFAIFESLHLRSERRQSMHAYPMVEQDGFWASVSVQRGPTGRWHSSVTLERSKDFARLKVHGSAPVRVPNTYPSEVRAVQAAYDHARMLIAREAEKGTLH
jgi:hypothetical protein